MVFFFSHWPDCFTTLEGAVFYLMSGGLVAGVSAASSRTAAKGFELLPGLFIGLCVFFVITVNF